MAAAQATNMLHYMQAFANDQQHAAPTGYELKADEALGVNFLVCAQTGVKLLEKPICFPSGVRHYQGYRWLYAYFELKGIRNILEGALPPMLPATTREPQAFMNRDAIAQNFDSKSQREMTGSCEFCVAFRMPSELVTEGNVPNRDIWLIRFGHDKVSPFLQAVSSGDAEKVKQGLQNLGSDVVDDDKKSALMYAAHAGHSDVVSVLLAAQADPSQVDKTGNTALMWAAHSGDAQVIKQLLAVSSKDAKNVHGVSALEIAQEMQRAEAVAALS